MKDFTLEGSAPLANDLTEDGVALSFTALTKDTLHFNHELVFRV